MSGTSRSPSSGATEIWHLTVCHGGGSVEHFYHFLLGFFVPMIYQISTGWADARFRRLIVRSCGPLDPLIRELQDARIEILDKKTHREMAETGGNFSSAVPPSTKLKCLTIHGCDYPATFNQRKFTKVRDTLSSRGNFQSEVLSLRERWPIDNPRILVVERGPSPAFYDSALSEVKSSGQNRRSIANHEKLVRSLLADHAGCVNYQFEALPLTHQFALFSLADIIIAQHGAALANIIWARPTATLIEIFPDTLRADQKEADFFFNLSKCMGIRYRRVPQIHEHADVDIDKVRRIVAECLASPHHPAIAKLRAANFRISSRARFLAQFDLMHLVAKLRALR